MSKRQQQMRSATALLLLAVVALAACGSGPRTEGVDLAKTVLVISGIEVTFLEWRLELLAAEYAVQDAVSPSPSGATGDVGPPGAALTRDVVAQQAPGVIALATLVNRTAPLAEAQRRGLVVDQAEVAARIAVERASFEDWLNNEDVAADLPQGLADFHAARRALIHELDAFDTYIAVIIPAAVSRELAIRAVQADITGSDDPRPSRAWTAFVLQLVSSTDVEIVSPDLSRLSQR